MRGGMQAAHGQRQEGCGRHADGAVDEDVHHTALRHGQVMCTCRHGLEGGDSMDQRGHAVFDGRRWESDAPRHQTAPRREPPAAQHTCEEQRDVLQTVVATMRQCIPMETARPSLNLRPYRIVSRVLCLCGNSGSSHNRTQTHNSQSVHSGRKDTLVDVLAPVFASR